MAKTYKGIFERIITFDALYAAYLKARRGKRKSWPCRHFEKNLEGELIELQNQLIWGEYRCAGYRSFYVNEPKRRKITALKSFRDRVLQNAIVTEIEPIWEARFISDTYACRPGRGTHAGADRAQEMLRQCLRKHGEIYVLKADVTKYFASINHQVLLALIRRRIADERLMAVIEEIVSSYWEPATPGVGLPIGNLTSQLFANLYLDWLDHWMKDRRRERWYIRYMDDFLVVGPDKRHLQALRIDTERFLQDELRLTTNHKTEVFPVSHKGGRGLDFLGFHLWPDGRRLRKGSIKRLKRQLKAWQSEYARGEINAKEIREGLHSWINHARHGHAIPAVQALLNNTVFKRGSHDRTGSGVHDRGRRGRSRNARRVGPAQAAREDESDPVPSQGGAYAAESTECS